MIAVLLHDGQTISINAAAKDVRLEGGALTIKRDGDVIARFGKHAAYWTIDDDQ